MLLFIGSHQAGHINTKGIDRFSKVKTLRVTFPLDEGLKPLPHGAVGKQPSNKEALIPTHIHQCRLHPIGVAISPTYSRLPYLPPLSHLR